MTEALVPLAVKFLEEGGLYALLGVFLLAVIAVGLVIVKLFDKYADCQEARIADNKELISQILTAVGETKATIDAATRTAEVNARLSEANQQTIEGLRELFVRSLLGRDGGR